MTPTQPYDSMSLMRFQMSLLSLGAALDRQSPAGPSEAPSGALSEAEQLKDMVERRTR